MASKEQIEVVARAMYETCPAIKNIDKGTFETFEEHIESDILKSMLFRKAEAAIDAANAPLLEAVREASVVLAKGALIKGTFTRHSSRSFRLECEGALAALRPFMPESEGK